MKKKVVSLLLAASLVTAMLSGCGNSGSSDAGTESAGTEEEADDAQQTQTDASNAEEGSDETPAEGSGETYKIGAIGPATGGAAVYGIAVQNGADLAIKEINEAGGINGSMIEYNFQDDECDNENQLMLTIP